MLLLGGGVVRPKTVCRRVNGYCKRVRVESEAVQPLQASIRLLSSVHDGQWSREGDTALTSTRHSISLSKPLTGTAGACYNRSRPWTPVA